MLYSEITTKITITIARIHTEHNCNHKHYLFRVKTMTPWIRKTLLNVRANNSYRAEQRMMNHFFCLRTITGQGLCEGIDNTVPNTSTLKKLQKLYYLCRNWCKIHKEYSITLHWMVIVMLVVWKKLIFKHIFIFESSFSIMFNWLIIPSCVCLITSVV